ncbi:MAG TPA: hypothetical protein VGK99_02155 [Acidobacteriota bacterium]|jgi:hypothetical protein
MRKRTTKQIAQRIELNYFQKPHPFRNWKRWLSIAALVAAMVWLLAYALMRDDKLYNPGPLSTAHSILESDCASCHTGARKERFHRPVSDQACEKCHAGPIHHINQIYQGAAGAQPPCASCHVEHKGESQLKQASDQNCTQCHSSLKTAPIVAGDAPGQSKSTTAGAFQMRNSSPVAPPVRPVLGYEKSITSFEANHPEFRLLRDKTADLAKIKLNHQLHLRPDLRGPHGPVKLDCVACHHLDARRAYMLPVNFQRDCQTCHSLAFEERIDEQAPHSKPEIVDAFIRIAFSKYAGKNPNEWRRPVDWNRARQLSILSMMVEEAPRNLPAWMERQIASAERYLFSVRCRECHLLENLPGRDYRTAAPIRDTSRASARLPQVLDPEIRVRWYDHSRFAHGPHRMLQCISCHSGARESTKTRDVLLPGRAECLRCHNSSTRVRSGCTECHSYHDKTKDRDRDGPLRLEDIVGGR